MINPRSWSEPGFCQLNSVLHLSWGSPVANFVVVVIVAPCLCILLLLKLP